MITVGFFWNVAAIAVSGTPCSTAESDLQRVAHHDVELAGGEQLQAVDLRAAHPDRHVEAVLLVDALGQRLVEAAVLGLREPVGGEHDAVGRLRVRHGGDSDEGDEGDENQAWRAGHRRSLGS